MNADAQRAAARHGGSGARHAACQTILGCVRVPEPLIPESRTLSEGRVACGLSEGRVGVVRGMCAAFLNDLHAFNPTSNTWRELSASATGTPPRATWQMGLAAARGSVFVFGGDATTFAEGAC